MTRTSRPGRKRRPTNRRQEIDRQEGTNRREKANRQRELERRVDRLEAEVAWLARVVREAGERDDALATGPCPNCSRGVLVHRNGELGCSACGYSRFL